MSLHPSILTIGLSFALLGCGDKDVKDTARDADADADTDTDTDTDTDADTDTDTESDCADGVDNDGDGVVDCEDADCVDVCEEDCSDGIDNDQDLYVDCEDDECYGGDNCSELYRFKQAVYLQSVYYMSGVQWLLEKEYPDATDIPDMLFLTNYGEVAILGYPVDGSGDEFLCIGDFKGINDHGDVDIFGYANLEDRYSYYSNAERLQSSDAYVDFRIGMSSNNLVFWDQTITYNGERQPPCPLITLPPLYLRVYKDRPELGVQLPGGSWYTARSGDFYSLDYPGIDAYVYHEDWASGPTDAETLEELMPFVWEGYFNLP